MNDSVTSRHQARRYLQHEQCLMLTKHSLQALYLGLLKFSN